MRTLIASGILILGQTSAFAHGGEAHPAHYPWTFDRWIVFPLCVVSLSYAVGSGRLLSHVSSGRPKPVARIICFFAGILSLAAALVSPLHWLGEHLFTYHMIEHEIVMAISAPLLVLSRPVAMCVWSLPRVARRGVSKCLNARQVRAAWNGLTGGLTATALHGVAIWVWHVPALLDASVADLATHRLQHLSFFITALLFWWSIFWRSERGAAAWHLFVTMMHTGVLGALIALSPQVLFVAQTADAQEWGLAPLQDQQIAGFVMWVPAGTVYAGTMIFLLARWIKDSSRSLNSA